MLLDVHPVDEKLRSAWDVTVVVDSRNDDESVTCRLVIAVGPRREQRPYLTNVDRRWQATQLAEAYRLRWQIELVFKELKQDLSLEKLPSKDPFAVQVFAWASLLALALSRTIASWLYPASNGVGTRSEIRSSLVTRALRSTVTLLVYALLDGALSLRRCLYDELWRLSRASSTTRADSLSRLA